MISPRKAIAIGITMLSPVVLGACSNEKDVAKDNTIPSTTQLDSGVNGEITEIPNAYSIDPNRPTGASIICGDDNVVKHQTFFILDSLDGKIRLNIRGKLVNVGDSAPESIKALIGESYGNRWVEVGKNVDPFLAEFEREDGQLIPFKIAVIDGVMNVSSLDEEGINLSTLQAHVTPDGKSAGTTFYSEASQITTGNIYSNGLQKEFTVPLSEGTKVIQNFSVLGNTIESLQGVSGLHTIDKRESGSSDCSSVTFTKPRKPIGTNDNMPGPDVSDSKVSLGL